MQSEQWKVFGVIDGLMIALCIGLQAAAFAFLHAGVNTKPLVPVHVHEKGLDEIVTANHDEASWIYFGRDIVLNGIYGIFPSSILVYGCQFAHGRRRRLSRVEILWAGQGIWWEAFVILPPDLGPPGAWLLAKSLCGRIRRRHGLQSRYRFFQCRYRACFRGFFRKVGGVDGVRLEE